MSAGRIVDLLALAIIILGVFVMTFAGGSALDPVRNGLNEDSVSGDIQGDKYRNEIFTVFTKWLPLVAVIGSIVVVLFREYRRQQVAGRRRR